MSKTGQWVIILFSLLIFLYLSAAAIGYFTGKFIQLASFLNAGLAASFVTYWTIRQIQVEQHIIDTREIIFLLFEVMVIAVTVIYFAGNQKYNWVKTLQSIFYGLHLTGLLFFLVFMLTFKMDRMI